MAVTWAERDLRGWWRHPVERHAFLRLPAVRGSFTSMAVDASGHRWWLAGDGGAVVATTDGGASWQSQPTGTHRQLSALYASDDGQKLWAVGEGGTVLVSADGGRQWRSQSSGIDRHLHAVEFAPDARRGWAVGNEGAAISTDDGGESWRRMEGLGTSRLRSVHFDPGGRVGVVIGEGGQVLLTEDGGRRWRDVGGATPNPDPSTIDSLIEQSKAMESRPVRAAQTQLRPDAAADGYRRGWIAATLSANGSRVGLVGELGTFSSSDDGGRTWTAPTPRGIVAFERADFSRDGQRGVAISPFSWIFSTADGGRLWRLHVEQTSRSQSAVRLGRDGLQAWVVGGKGALLKSRDGGQSWAPATRDALESLASIGFSDDDRLGWAVGTSGALLRTEDGGASWRPQSAPTTGGLGVLYVGADGMKAWATDPTGLRSIQTTNGGASWEQGDLNRSDARAAMERPRRPLQPPMPLPWGVRSGYIGADGQRGWAVGDGGLLLTTSDGGKTWTDPRVYARYPAPWYWLALLLSVPMFLRSWRLFTQARLVVAGMAETPATDAALTDPRQDRLNFEPLAAGISRFLRNPATEPPLTLAVTGDWGSGKSSLMGLICADLRKHGSRPIWFNAWHHQKEDHLFAALLGALSKQAPPPWLSLDGIGFRLRLLWLRSRKHWIFTLLLCTAVAALITLHLGMNDAVAETQLLRQLGDLLTSLSGWGSAKPDAASTAARSAPPVPWAGWLALLTVAGTTLAALRKALTAFGADPAALLAGGL
ncbi:YCF48-related protein, partial [Roseateles sp.]|uniref:YCF48-related protein n=1 Tax=Roseateles sp. TaxID=1971397 RepID=UPI002F40E5F0